MEGGPEETRLPRAGKGVRSVRPQHPKMKAEAVGIRPLVSGSAVTKGPGVKCDFLSIQDEWWETSGCFQGDCEERNDFQAVSLETPWCEVVLGVCLLGVYDTQRHDCHGGRSL